MLFIKETKTISKNI